VLHAEEAVLHGFAVRVVGPKIMLIGPDVAGACDGSDQAHRRIARVEGGGE